MTCSLSLIRRVVMTAVSLAIACSLYFYPAAMTLRAVADAYRGNDGAPGYIGFWHHRLSQRFVGWGQNYLKERRASHLDFNNVAATEWPMFGSVYYLLTVDALIDQHALEYGKDPAIKKAVETAADIVADPVTATWVIQMYGDDYLKTDNVFYRMMLIMGLTSYQKITGNNAHEALLREQANSLAEALAAAPHHILDDYPGACYPNDVIWAVAGIRRADALLGMDHSRLAADLMDALDKDEAQKLGIPAYMADPETGRPQLGIRGDANSGMLNFAPELNLQTALRWYGFHEANFWQRGRFLWGFREFENKKANSYWDVDAGPVMFGIGSVASGFGIGAARTVGRLDHAAPMAAELIAMSWPTPMGHILPSVMSRAADAPPLGEVAMLFNLTRPVQNSTTPFKGPMPLIVWILIAFYAAVGALWIAMEIRRWRQWTSRSLAGCDPPLLSAAWVLGLGIFAVALLGRWHIPAILGLCLAFLASERANLLLLKRLLVKPNANAGQED